MLNADVALPEEVTAGELAELALSLLEKLRKSIERNWGQIGRDALDDAAGHVWRKIAGGQFNRSRGALEPWLRTVVKRYLISTARKSRRRARHESLISSQPNQHAHLLSQAAGNECIDTEAHSREMERFWNSRFPPEDLIAIENWDVYDRVMLLCMTGLWRKVPGRMWNRWVSQAAADRPGVKELPLAALAESEQRHQRTALLAKSLAVPRNTLVQQWKRKHKLVEDLASIRALYAEA